METSKESESQMTSAWHKKHHYFAKHDMTWVEKKNALKVVTPEERAFILSMIYLADIDIQY